MASGIYLNKSVWTSPLVGYNKKQKPKGRRPMLEETAGSCYYKLRSYYQITTGPCHPEEEQQQQQQKGEMCFF